MPVEFTVYGQCYSLKNSKMLARGRTIKHPKASLFEMHFQQQIPRNFINIFLGSKEAPLRAVITAWYPTLKQDLDVEIVFDQLQKCGVVSNDRWIREKHLFAEVDKVNPRVTIRIEAA